MVILCVAGGGGASSSLKLIILNNKCWISNSLLGRLQYYKSRNEDFKKQVRICIQNYTLVSVLK